MGPNCFARNSLIVLEDGTREPVCNLQEGHKVLAMNIELGQLVPTEVKTNSSGQTKKDRSLLRVSAAVAFKQRVPQSMGCS